MDYKQKYEQALEYMRTVYPTLTGAAKEDVEHHFPELKESEDEKVRKHLLRHFRNKIKEDWNGMPVKNILAWLEKQKDYEDELEKAYKTADEVQYRIGYEAAKREFEKQGEMKPQDNSALEVWKDMRLEVYQQASGNRHEPNYSDDSTKMFSLTDIDEIFEKVAEKQGEHKSKDRYTFNSIPRLLEMIKPTSRAKVYCQKLIDSLLKEGYTTDAKIVSNCLKQMNGEKVAMATMDEQKPAWSEEDETRMRQIISDLEQCTVPGFPIYIGGIELEINWLKSLKERMKGE